MSVSAAQVEAFYEEVLRAGQVWAIGDEGGCAPTRTAWHERSGRACAPERDLMAVHPAKPEAWP